MAAAGHKPVAVAALVLPACLDLAFTASICNTPLSINTDAVAFLCVAGDTATHEVCLFLAAAQTASLTCQPPPFNSISRSPSFLLLCYPVKQA